MSNLPEEQMRANRQLMNPDIVRLLAIERRLKLLFKGSDEWVAEILNPGPGWETDKALACVRELRALCEGKTAEEVSWLPVK